MCVCVFAHLLQCVNEICVLYRYGDSMEVCLYVCMFVGMICVCLQAVNLSFSVSSADSLNKRKCHERKREREQR